MNNIIKSICFIGILFAGMIFSDSTVSAQESRVSDSLTRTRDTINPEVLDSLSRISVDSIVFNSKEAIEYISAWYNNQELWNNPDDPLRRTMGRFLYEATMDSFYISEWFLDDFNWETIKIPASSFYLWDTLHIYLPEKPNIQASADTTALSDSLAALPFRDNLRIGLPDSIIIDTLTFQAVSDLMQDSLQQINPSLDSTMLEIRKEAPPLRDSIVLVISDTLREVISSNQEFPFSSYNYPMVGDSIQAAMNALREFAEKRDSSQVFFVGSDNIAPVWLSNGPNTLTRLRLRNEWNEELSLWIGSPSRDSVSIIVEDGVHFRRPKRETRFAEAKVDVKILDNSKLADARKIDFKPRYWKFLSEASFVFNQAMITNWSKGGESNISTLIDLTGTANYTNKEDKMTWNTLGQFKYGLQMSGEYGVRKNVDVIDIGSKFNNKAFGKFDFSAMLIFKTQLARGYKYPNDSVVISKFFNPATLTIGLGLDYKPNKNTSINFAPLSYKGTFVPDTVHIDQTKHGLTIDQRSKHEPGMSAQINHKTVLWEKVNLSNRVRLFTNYIDNPLNIDIEWEMIATTKLNWFTDIRLNTHLIYDDDTLIPVFDKNDEPVLGSDGKQKSVPKVQFKELIGVSIIFRF